MSILGVLDFYDCKGQTHFFCPEISDDEKSFMTFSSNFSKPFLISDTPIDIERQK